MWEALRAVQLAEMVQAHPAGLAMPMAEYGSNLSAGECQLVCVARALLKPVKILLVDEVSWSWMFFIFTFQVLFFLDLCCNNLL